MSVLDTEAYRQALAVWMLHPAELDDAQRATLEAGRAEVPGQRAGCYPLPLASLATQPVATPRSSG